MAAETLPASDMVQDPKSELDSHANMVVLGKNCFVFEWSGQSCSVHPFSDTLGTVKNVPIVDAAIAYDCPYRLETYVLLFRNALYLPTLENNLIPPFIMREGGVIVNEIAKIHCDDPTEDDHCIRFRNHELSIPLRLSGTFSFFHTRTPTDEELQSCDKIFITPDSSHWNPYCPSFCLNEESMLDYNGDIADKSRRTHHLMDVDDEYPVIASVSISEHDAAVDNIITYSFHAVPEDSTLGDDSKFYNAISERAEISKVMGSIGSVHAGSGSSCELFSNPTEGPIYRQSYLL
jgi:hypothetical protein